MACTRWHAGRDGVRFVNHFTGDKGPFFSDDLIKQVRRNAAAISQPIAECADTLEVTERPDHWLSKFTEASYNGWLQQGSHSYGI